MKTLLKIFSILAVLLIVCSCTSSTNNNASQTSSEGSIYKTDSPEKDTIAATVSTESKSPEVSQNDRNVLGRWKDDLDNQYILYREDGVYYMENRFVDGSGNVDILEAKVRRGKTTYNVEGDPYEFFMIQHGDLYVYDADFNLGLVWKSY